MANVQTHTIELCDKVLSLMVEFDVYPSSPGSRDEPPTEGWLEITAVYFNGRDIFDGCMTHFVEYLEQRLAAEWHEPATDPKCYSVHDYDWMDT